MYHELADENLLPQMHSMFGSGVQQLQHRRLSYEKADLLHSLLVSIAKTHYYSLLPH